MIMGGDHVLKVVGLNPRTVYWIGIYLLWELQCLFDKYQNRAKKRPGMAHCFEKDCNL